MNVARFLARAGSTLARALWTGDLTTKLLILIGLAVGASFLGAVAGPVTKSLVQMLVVLAFLSAIYSFLLRR